ncbi:MAG: hypothetical protein R6U08_06145, partial [Bacillota bacterium]
FTINDLICVRVEDEQVFNECHRLIFQLLGEGLIHGLRIDHVDGLYDPTAYLQRLRKGRKNLYLIVEKILEPGEELPAFWPIQGTTGYEFLSAVNGVQIRRSSEKALDEFYRSVTGRSGTFSWKTTITRASSGSPPPSASRKTGST